MEYQIVHSKISVDKLGLLILSWQIPRQPIRQLLHGRNVSGRGSIVLLRPRGHLLRQNASIACFLNNIFTHRTQGPDLPVSCSSLTLSQILQGSATPGPASVVSPGLPLQPHTEPLSLLRSPQEGADPEIYAPVGPREIRICLIAHHDHQLYTEPTYRMAPHKGKRMGPSL